MKIYSKCAAIVLLPTIISGYKDHHPGSTSVVSAVDGHTVCGDCRSLAVVNMAGTKYYLRESMNLFVGTHQSRCLLKNSQYGVEHIFGR